MKLRVKHILLVLLAIPVIITWSCSPKTLAIFFDGVPIETDTISSGNDIDGNMIASTGNNSSPAKANKVRYFFHSPYKTNDCATCHDPRVMGKLQEPVPTLCYQCHDDFASSFSMLHAPVEAGECLLCHKPHLSENRKLLIKSVRDLCFECHDAGEVLQAEQHTDIDDADCTDCHNPHGGNERFYLN